MSRAFPEVPGAYCRGMDRRLLRLVVSLSGLTFATAACTNGASTGSSTSTTGTAPPASAAAASAPVGPGCAEYARNVPNGPGSVAGMAKTPLASAAASNPELTTLVSAVSGRLNPEVNLVDTLNKGQFTLFAPVDSAFRKVPSATVSQLKSNSGLLTSLLTYHVVIGRLSPKQVIGTQKTVQGGDLTVKGKPDNLTVNGVKVLCGGVSTSNATVYLIDGVLVPGR
jgi:uncharacterized surface protein with fasciclin (FAS1) repeats